MMSPHENMKPPATKDETNVSSGRKAAAAASSRPPQDPPPKCPRCDSPNTKFCYYNNYSLTQPRHFCKTCRRYWTNGGALRNVPIGGGCRKSKKIKPSPRTSDDSNNSDVVGGLKFFQGLSPAMDFQLNFPRNTGLLNQFSSLDNLPNPNCFGLDNPSAASSSSPLGFGFQEMGSLNCHQGSNLTSSIESLSSINQDLHWKLQKQRLGLLFVGDNNNNQKQNNNYSNIIPSFETLVQNPRPQPILFQNLDLSCAADIRKDDAGGGGDACGNNNNNNTTTSLSTEWFFDNSYATTMNPTPATSGTNLNGDTNNWNGVQDLY